MRLVVILSGIIGCQAVFIPADLAALQVAVNSCISETPDGSCPNFAASNDATGNPHGVIGDWDISQVTSLFRLFRIYGYGSVGATSCYFNSDISKWDTSSVTTMRETFEGCYDFNSDLSSWDVSNVVNMEDTFNDCHVFTSDLSSWNTSKVTNMKQTFKYNRAFNSDLSAWDVSKVTNMWGTFAYAEVFISDLSSWDVSKSTEFYYMFAGGRTGRPDSIFNSDLSTWDVSNAKSGLTGLSSMFRDAKSFNSDLSKWNFPKVTMLTSTFFGASSFNSDLSNWDVSQMENVNSMFRYATSFNSDLSGWDTSNVWTTQYMFAGASSFNSDLSNWDVSNVIYISGMFASATAFLADSMDLSSWNVVTATDKGLNVGVTADSLASCAWASSDAPKFQGCEYCEDCTSNNMVCKVGSGSFTCNCDIGHYKNVAGDNLPWDATEYFCKPCEPGKYQDQTNEPTCKDCPSGKSSLSGWSACLNATQIKQKFLVERNPDLVPAYNMANSC